MASIKWTLQSTNLTLERLVKGTKIFGSRLWAKIAITKGKAISDAIGQMLVKNFENTEVAMALRGQGSEDLPAHFGLSDSLANSLVDGMSQLIRSSVKIGSRSESDAVSVRIQAVETNWNDYLSLPGASYVSSQSNIVIPVAKWLLVDPNIDVGQAAYDIVFKGEDADFDVRIQHTSRSGRAIMVSLEALGGSGGYVLPAIVAGNAGQNFIEYALGQPNVLVDAAKILMEKVG